MLFLVNFFVERAAQPPGAAGGRRSRPASWVGGREATPYPAGCESEKWKSEKVKSEKVKSESIFGPLIFFN